MILKANNYKRKEKEYSHMLGHASMYTLFGGVALNAFIKQENNILNYTQCLVFMAAANIGEGPDLFISRTRYRVVHKLLLLPRIPYQYMDYSFGEFVRLELMEKA